MTDYTGSNTPADQRDLWRTPPALFAALDAEFCFQLDAAAAPHNALCRKFITAEQNTLETPWSDYLNIPGYAWLNPPYSDITPFVKKAAAESKNQIGTLPFLLTASITTPYHLSVVKNATNQYRSCVALPFPAAIRAPVARLIWNLSVSKGGRDGLQQDE